MKKKNLLIRLFAVVAAMMFALSNYAQEAYACYTSADSTLTFYYDNLRSTRPGTTYDLNTGANETDWKTDGINTSVTKVVFDSSFADARPTTTAHWFDSMTNLQSLSGMEYLNTTDVTDMSYMFNSCSKLVYLDLSYFRTGNVTDMYYMFRYCRNLVLIYAGSGWNTDAVTRSDRMFLNCSKLVGGKGTMYYTSNPQDKTYAHLDGGPSNPGYLREKGSEAYAEYIKNSKTLNFHFDDQRMFRPGTTFDMNDPRTSPGWSNSNVQTVVFDPSFADARPTSTAMWFSDQTNLDSIIGLNYLNTDSVTTMTFMFYSCYGLTSVDLSHFNTANVTDMSRMFSGTELSILDLSSFNTAKVTDMSSMFDGCAYTTTIYVGSGWSTESVTSSHYMFYNCWSLVGSMGTVWDADHLDVEYAHIDGGPSNPGYFTGKQARPEPYAVYTPNNTTLTFYYDDQLESHNGLATFGLNTGSEDVEWYDIPYYFTRVVFDPSFADARPTTTYCWFNGMSNLVSITGIEYLNTDSVTNMAQMFRNCRKLPSVDLSHFNTANVTTMYFMFANCRAMTHLDLSSFNTDNVTTMECMFYYCTGLTTLDLSSFTNARVRRTANMFDGCSDLTTIYATSSWSLPANNYSFAMFLECTSLVGGMGTTFDASHTDAAYARIDGGPSNPGYFTEKVDFLRGDVNGDGTVSIADVTALIDMLMSGDAINNDAADVNGDGVVSIADVTELIDYLLTGSWD